ncbi:MAG: orotidine-5'-phosphate decarboxylase [Phycisphaerales bacterium]
MATRAPASPGAAPTMSTDTDHASDRLLRRVEAVGAPICVGLDPVWEKLPATLRAGHAGLPSDASAAAALERFSVAVLDAVRGLAPAVKIQAACFERHGAEGYAALARTLAAAHEGFQVILDWKRGDIGVSAEHYAQASRAALASDWTTVNSYLGTDGIEPFLQPGADEHGHGAFALVRTSNPSGDALQSLRLQDGRTVSEAVADMVAAAGVLRLGSRGYSDLGAVVGATKRADAAALRTRMPRQIFLVPGFGAQGGGVDDVLPCFNTDGQGALITASRSVIYAFKPDDARWTDSVRRAAEEFHQQIARGLGVRGAGR